MSNKQYKQKIWDLIKDIKVGMLTTQDGSDLRARPMHIVQDSYDGTLWFYTKKSAEKVTEAKNENVVCLTFNDPNDGIYISLSGHAHLTKDKDLIDKFWNPFAAAWFKDGKDDQEVALLEVKVYQGEHWEQKGNKLTQLFEITKANFSNEMPDIGKNQKFG